MSDAFPPASAYLQLRLSRAQVALSHGLAHLVEVLRRLESDMQLGLDLGGRRLELGTFGQLQLPVPSPSTPTTRQCPEGTPSPACGLVDAGLGRQALSLGPDLIWPWVHWA